MLTGMRHYVYLSRGEWCEITEESARAGRSNHLPRKRLRMAAHDAESSPLRPLEVFA